ncbi:MAG: hypothetical protein LBB61_10805, partial [Treponema sp.]|nr:hypothetical protein [Treponema sp.]
RVSWEKEEFLPKHFRKRSCPRAWNYRKYTGAVEAGDETERKGPNESLREFDFTEFLFLGQKFRF